MRYIDQSLTPGETVLARGRWPAVFWVGAWAALLLLGVLLIGIYIFVRAVIVMKTTDFAVTSRRVILKSGWLNRRTAEIAVGSIEGVSVQQSILARLFGYGRVIVTGTGEATIAFPPMARPVEFRRAIEAARAHGHEVTVVSEDEARDRAEAELANENDPPPRKRRRPSFIGLRAR